VKGFAPDGVISDLDSIMKALEDYSVLITPWAKAVANYMLADTARREAKTWKTHGIEMSRAIRAELAYAPTGVTYRKLMDEQVALIKSMPLDAAQRVHHLATLTRTDSTRASTVAKEILKTGEVSEAKARLIARTEVSRSAETFKQARARFAGSEGYIWRTSGDSDVRDTHQRMEGVYVRWDHPPKTDKGLDPYHAGCGPNCRCYAEPVLPDL